MLKVYKLSIKPPARAKNIKIVFMSDLHYGHEDFRGDILDKYIEYVKKNPNCYFALPGDLIENAIHSHMGFTMWSQEMTPEKQVADIIKKFEPVKDRCLFVASGNHEDRTWKATSFHPARFVAEALDTLFIDIGGYVVINVGKQEYVCAIQHGASSAINPDYEFEKMRKVYGDAEILVLSHNHQLYDTVKATFGADGKRRYIMFIRTGAFLDYAAYSQVKLYAPSIVGAAILTLGVDEHEKRADTSATLTTTKRKIIRKK